MKTIDFGAKNPELDGWEYTIPEGMEATVENGKIILRERERESEDERIRKFLVKHVSEWIGCIEHDLKLSSGDVESEEELAMFKAGLAYLERQKEQPADAKSERVIKAARRVLNNWLDGTDCPDVSGDFAELEHAIREYDGEEKQTEPEPTEPSNEELQRHQDELYDFKVFATKQAKEHHISVSFVHDFEWNNFCAELLSYFNEKQKPADCIEDSVKFEEGFKAGRESGLRDGQKYVLNNLDSYGLCKPAEWSEEDKRKLENGIKILKRWEEYFDLEHAPYSSLLKSLPERFNLQPKQEWDEFDEDCLKRAIWYVENPAPSVVKDTNLVLWLKSLPMKCPKSSDDWKPSDEQLRPLEYAIDYFKKKKNDTTYLESLYNDLKKL